MEWISVKERLPTSNIAIGYTYDGIHISHITEYDEENKQWYIPTWRGHTFVDITHWMPLPEPPNSSS